MNMKDQQVELKPKMNPTRGNQSRSEKKLKFRLLSIPELWTNKGESRYAKAGTLKREAKTLDHLMTHRFSNPYCDSCLRAKMKHFKKQQGAFKEVLSKFGDLITFDSLTWVKLLRWVGENTRNYW